MMNLNLLNNNIYLQLFNSIILKKILNKNLLYLKINL